MALFVEEAGGMDKIHNLQMSDNSEIYKKAYGIIDKYFQDDGEEDDGIAPDIDSTTGNFTFGANDVIPSQGFNFGK